MKKCLTQGLWTLLFLTTFGKVLATTTMSAPIITLSAKDIESISDKIWQNESGKSIPWLTYWNPGESFPSLGIGHFIWYTAQKREDFDESFPKVIQYMREKHITMPPWLDKTETPPCPWTSREEFLLAIENKEPRLEELRQFLLETKAIQAQYFIYRLETILPIISDLVPKEERNKIENNIAQLKQNPTGIYALVDYVNFKGDGVKEYKRCSLKQSPIEIQEIGKNLPAAQVYACGWGLLQALRKMLQAPASLSPNDAFSWATSEVLKIRVASAPENRKSFEEKWLPGWLKRTHTYLSEQKKEL